LRFRALDFEKLHLEIERRVCGYVWWETPSTICLPEHAISIYWASDQTTYII
jgi:hypothetical protein